ncbi:hypothetical protein ACFCYN_15135 [Gottfriedia sp. NPDC056225]|uniref:hypothetical protein n=1 Tax=Gottfriedia sp. NPDC056225 TaxID=3345751 RepID=UPI0035D689D7
MMHSLILYGYGEIVLQLVLLILTILFFVFICLFFTNSIIKGVKRKNEVSIEEEIMCRKSEEGQGIGNSE